LSKANFVRGWTNPKSTEFIVSQGTGTLLVTRLCPSQKGSMDSCIPERDAVKFIANYGHIPVLPSPKGEGVSKQLEVSNSEPTMPLNTRANSALLGIYEISKALARPARLEITLAGVINLLAGFLDMKDCLIE